MPGGLRIIQTPDRSRAGAGGDGAAGAPPPRPACCENSVADADSAKAAATARATERERMFISLLLEGRQVAFRTGDLPNLEYRAAVLLLIADERDLVARLQRVLRPTGALQLVRRRQPARPLGRRAVRILHVHVHDDVRVDEVHARHRAGQRLRLRLIEGRAAMMRERRARAERENRNEAKQQ